MFQRLGIFALFISITGLVFADESATQIVTSEVFTTTNDSEYSLNDSALIQKTPTQIQQQYVPVWPLAGSDADVAIVCDGEKCDEPVAKFDLDGWSGGPSIDNGLQVPAGFDNECDDMAEMPLLHRELLEDDGGYVLSASRSAHKNCAPKTDSYLVFAQRAGFTEEDVATKTTEHKIQVQDNSLVVEESADARAPIAKDSVRSWVVASGQTLRQVLQSWCDTEGWDLVWTTSREYPIEASAVFKGRFIDVASALIRNFERATPIPYAKFYKGNRVIVVSTTEE
ncbi:MAG: toxin co-regulated pilus biosynthesis Q family protein [Alphaproteobacteria bacterium]|nr:toxin co-regulated pilus biosynthesis Q family protein [Alphaproteobacteria bacterium]